ncbi:MAG: stage III sporulation protein AD [Butyribacter sp.]|nr:stage III sporulation protein AD [bacterium]MDY3854370.1 stage III sporulation protein AD [Butyribacter sp.]
MLKVAIIGVMAVFLAMILRQDKAEFGMLVILAACLLIVTLSLDKLRGVVEAIQTLEQYLGKGSMYIGILLKMIGITYVAEFGANLCSDAGYKAVANQIEFYGKLMILAVSIPILTTLVEMIGGL